MLWEQSNRFTLSPKNEPVLSFDSFSQYLRQQFHQSRNIFHHYQEYRSNQNSKKSNKVQHYHQSENNLSGVEESGTLETVDVSKDGKKVIFLLHFKLFLYSLSQIEDNTFFLTQVSDKQHGKAVKNCKQSETKPKKLKKKKRLILLKSKVLPSYLSKSTPGPCSYNLPNGLIKASFNRVYSEPPPVDYGSTSLGVSTHFKSTVSLRNKLESKKPLVSNVLGLCFLI
jgi:hypothetical protein